MYFTPANVTAWTQTPAGQEWTELTAKRLINEARSLPPTPAAVTAWVLTPDGQSWYKDFSKQHVGSGLVDKKAAKEAAELAAGRCVKIPTGPPLTLAMMADALKTLTALIPTNADHTKFADVISTAAASELVLARKTRNVADAYAR